jgi:hypothetical protein
MVQCIARLQAKVSPRQVQARGLLFVHMNLCLYYMDLRGVHMHLCLLCDMCLASVSQYSGSYDGIILFSQPISNPLGVFLVFVMLPPNRGWFWICCW